MTNPEKVSKGEGKAEKTAIEGGIEKGVSWMIDQFGDKLAGDDAEYKIYMKSKEGKAQVKRMVAKTIIGILAAGAPTDDEGKPLQKTHAEQVRAGVMRLVGDMGSRLRGGKFIDDVKNFDSNWADFTRQVDKEVEGMLYDHSGEIDAIADELRSNAEDMINRAAKLLS